MIRRMFRLACLAPLLVALALPACRNRARPAAEQLAGGDADRGAVALRQYACSTCHVIPGIVGADALVGPPLNGIGSRKYLAGVLQNTPENMVHWIRYPQEAAPLSAMPDLGVTERDARDMVAYLYQLTTPSR
ncbi:MAG TPA: c-type cytochrome [Vicinamibacterales bacterium]|nr:c-type cytochrome [Vicinamibacterales bacterium]